MKSYPSIEKVYVPPGIPCVAFYKYDGSNLRVEWNRKTKQWYKWGTRRRLFNKTDPEYGCAIEIFERDYQEELTKVLIDNKEFRGAQSVVAFLEFFGPHSFAGQHDPKVLKVDDNDPKELVLFDVNIHKKGIIGPRRFIQCFGHLKIPQVIYDGNLNKQFVEDIRQGKYPVNEGVVCKGGDGHKVWMKKIKTNKYLEELKTRFAENWEDFWE